MPQGSIEDISEFVQWNIPNFLSRRLSDFIVSPRFAMAGCTWYTRVKMEPNGCVWYFLHKDDPKIESKMVSITIGIKIKDGIAREVRGNHTFCEGDESWCLPLFSHLDDLKKCKSHLAPTGALILTCQMERKEPTPEEIARSCLTRNCKMELEELRTLSSDFKGLLISEGNGDVTLNVQGKEFRAHRTVLAARSPVFRAMYQHDTAEAKSENVNIPDCDPESFGEFLSFLYTGKTVGGSFNTMLNLYATAEKYDVQQLKSFCVDCLKLEMTKENVSDIFVLADRYGDDALMSEAQTYFNKKFCEIILTSEWTTLTLKDNPRLANKVMKKMASAASKSS